MMNPWALLGLVLFWIVSMAAVGNWQNKAGHVAERTAWQAKENQELAQANAQILKLETDARSAERRQALDQASISTQYQKELDNAKRKTNDLVARLHAGTIRLRDPNYAVVQACGGAAGQAPSGTSGRDGAQGGELSEPASEFLLNLTGDADQVATQLAACQAIIKNDRQEIKP